MRPSTVKQIIWITLSTIVFLFVLLTAHWFMAVVTVTAFTQFIDGDSNYLAILSLTIASPVLSILLYEVYRFIAIDTDD